jgi:hypothetical protein
MAEVVVGFGLPSRVFHPNGRCSRRAARWAAIRKFRGLVGQIAAIAIREQLDGQRPLWRRATAQITIWYGPRQQKMDDDNVIAWMKPAFDGLQDAGVVANDRGITHLPPVHERDRALPRIEIRIRETEE